MNKQHEACRLTLMPLLVLLLVFGLCCGKSAHATGKPLMYWIEDEQSTMTFDQVRHQDIEKQWNKATQNFPNFGFTDSTFWLCLAFENLQTTTKDMLLEIAFPLHDHIDAYLINEAGEVVKTYQTGDQRPFTERPLDHRNFLFPHTLAPGEKLRAIVRVKSTDTMYLPASIWQSNQFIVKDQHQTLFLGLFFGCLSIMLVYNLFLFLSTRQKNYLYYVLFTTTILYLQLTQKNLGFQYLWPEQPFFNHISIPISSLLAMTSSLFFIFKFLKLEKEQHANTILIFNVFIWITLLGALSTTVLLFDPLSIIPYSTIVLSTAVMGAFTTIIIMATLLRLAFTGMRSAQILSVAWFSLLAGSFLFALGRLGAPLPMFWSENAMLIGSTFEAVLISFALARQIKREREARIDAQELALNHERQTREAQNALLLLQHETTQKLEQEVRERTQKLEMAMENLTAANHKLDNLARHDGLTGLSNRRDFDQECQRIWLYNLQQKTPVSLLMADIDYFKKINDTYGHLEGDKCLVRVAEVMKNCVQQSEALLARFGGEEFIVLLPDTDTQTAVNLAEHIRQHTEQLNIEHENGVIRFTLSVGVATTIPTPDNNCTDLIARADQSLYLAKEGGRNCIVTLDNCTKKPTKAIKKATSQANNKQNHIPQPATPPVVEATIITEAEIIA